MQGQGGAVIFEYKCEQGHLTEKRFPWRTEYDKHASMLCPKCMELGKTNEAYLVFACPEQRKKSV